MNNSKYNLTINGLMLTVKYKIRNRISYRKLVSFKFIKLLNLIISDMKFDQDLYQDLDETEVILMNNVVTDMKFENIDYTNAFALKLKEKYNRIKLIEGSIKIGNNNQELVDEYISILNELKKYKINDNLLFTNLIKRVRKMIKIE